jgi:hypothetical protein
MLHEHREERVDMAFIEQLKKEHARPQWVETTFAMIVGVVIVGLVPKATWWWSAPVLVALAGLTIALVKGLARPTAPRLLLMAAAVVAAGVIMHWLS